MIAAEGRAASSRLPRSPLGLLASAAALFYVGWNIAWLGRGVLPPSILLGLAGVPAPTTGMTRSVAAALAGDLRGSLAWNALTGPLLALLATSLALLVIRAARGRRIVLPPVVARAWLLVLFAAWVTKLAQGPAWW